MDCKQALNLLNGYTDGELSLSEVDQVREHLAGCKACAEEESRLRALSLAVKQIQPRRAPEALRKRWLPTAPVAEPVQPRSRLILPSWLLVAAACLFIGFFLGRSSLTGASLSQELVSSHLRSLIGAHLIDVPSSDRHTVKPWFDGKVDFSVTPYDLTSDGFPLKGGRLDYVDGRPTPVFVYGRRLHVINLYVFQGPVSVADGQVRGYQVVTWKEGDATYAAVSDVSLEDLELFRRAFASQN